MPRGRLALAHGVRMRGAGVGPRRLLAPTPIWPGPQISGFLKLYLLLYSALLWPSEADFPCPPIFLNLNPGRGTTHVLGIQ